MALSSHRKLNVEQLINLAQVYWDDPGKLMEIVEATEARMDPAAQLLFGAVTNRLNRLRSDPMKALGETPPDLAALIAARLGTQASATAPEEPPPAEAEAPHVQGEAKDQRRRWPLAAALAALLIGAATVWWLWPRADDAKVESAKREVGIEIQEGGLMPVEETAKTGTSSALPPGRRRPEFPPPREHEELERELQEKATGATTARAGAAGMPVVKDPNDVAEARDVAAPGSGRSAASGGGSGGGAAGGGGRDAATAARVAGRPASGSSVRASAGITIEESLLQCYLTDNRPTACAPAGGGGGGGGRSGSGGAASAAGVGGSSSAPPARQAAPAGRDSTESATAASPAGSGERAERSSAGGRGSGAASSGGSGGSAAADGGAGAAQRPSASASARGSAGGGGDATKRPASQTTQLVAVPPDPDCPDEPQEGRVVFIFDGSISMALPLGLDPAEEDRLDDGVRRRDPEARREYRALLQEAGPKRMGRAQAAFADAAAELPDNVELGLVAFHECRDIRKIGVFDAGSRGNAIDYVQKMIPRGRTPLADSLTVASEMLGDGPSSIVLLTDGIEFCSGDPCAAAEQLKAARPGIPIHIVDVTGQRRTECVAQITGGRSYAPPETEDLTQVLRNAFRGAAPRCGG